MSLLLKTIRSFPRGRTIEELQSLLGTTFASSERLSFLTELENLERSGHVRRLSNGKWLPIHNSTNTENVSHNAASYSDGANPVTSEFLHSARFVASEPELSASLDEADKTTADQIDTVSLIKYYRSALRSDPRGALTENTDRHGTTWHLISGYNRLVPSSDGELLLRFDLEALAPEFRTALLKREANENALALGWPICVGRKSGVPAIWPVGLIAASWKRSQGELLIEIAADDILVNPDWIRGASRTAGWQKEGLAAVFDAEDGVGLEKDDFLFRLGDAAATLIQSDFNAPDLQSELSVIEVGIFNAAALFLPDESTFTAGAIRDLDTIGTWEASQLQRTALGTVLGLPSPTQPKNVHPINVGPLNAEQIDAVRKACSAPLSVVTGPPGTGKSQAIVSMAASILANNGSVLVASKNHQALDAVEERLGSIAEDSPFIVRTLDPNKSIDTSFSSILKELVSETVGTGSYIEQSLVSDMFALADLRVSTLDQVALRAQLECRIAETLDQLALETNAEPFTAQSEEPERSSETQQSWLRSAIDLLLGLFSQSHTTTSSEAMPTPQKLASILEELRAERDKIGDPADPVEQTNKLAELASKLLPMILSNRTNLYYEDRDSLDQQLADLEFAGAKSEVPTSLASSVISHRPLWLASVLGTPKRIPLVPALFDLVIFDEASQCDIGSALPLMARAKRAVIVGDNNQLNFIAQLGKAQDRNLMQAQGLPISKMSRFAQSKQSLFDFARRVPGSEKILLRQQYRSAGPIVDYISANFYGGELRTSYDPSTIKAPRAQKPGIHWTDVPSPLAGRSDNVNPAEVAAILDHLEHLLMRENYTGTIGVTSPFRNQVAAISAAVRKQIPEQKLIGADFRVATVDGFQGQERDLILFSPTLGATSPSTALTFVQKDPRRLNVAISRARAVAHVFGDLSFARSRKVKTLASLAAAATEPQSRVGEGKFDSHWERIVFHALKDRGLDPTPQYQIAGRRLDFALFGSNGVKLDLEIDGRRWHQNADGSRKISDYWRNHQLFSLGWRVRRFWVDELAKDLEACLDIIEQDLSQN